LNSSLFINLFFLMFSIAVFIGYTKPDNSQLILIGLTLLTFWPIHLYMPTAMRVVPFCALSILAAALFWHAFVKAHTVSYRHLILLFITLFLLTLAKLTNAILFLPYFLVARNRFGYTVKRVALMAMILIVIGSFLSIVVSAPYPNYISTLPALLSHSFREGGRSLILHTFGNIHNYVNYKHHPLWLMLRAQLLLTISAGCWLLWRAHKNGLATQESVFILITSGGTALAAIILYDVFDWRDYRLFAPIVLMITLLLIAQKRTSLVLLIIIGNIVLLPVFVRTYSSLLIGAFPEEQTVSSISSFSEEIVPVIKYDKNMGGWDNTLLVPLSVAADRRMLGVPPGIGITWFTSPYELGEIKSRYLLLDHENYDILKEWGPLQHEVSTSIGDLYLNRMAEAGE
jgi:hypothetical protein